MAGYKQNATLLASSISYIINVVMTVPALIWLDRWGRRPTLLAGSVLMALWMFANAGILGAHGIVVPGGVNNTPEESMKVTGAAATGLIACTYLFVASFAPTWGPVSWVCIPPTLEETHQYTNLMQGLPTRTLPSPPPWKGCGTLYVRKLGVQHRAGRFCPTRLCQHQVADLHCLWRLQSRCLCPRVLLLP